MLEIGAGYCDWINNVEASRRVAIDIWPELPRHTAAGVEPIVLDIAKDLGTLNAGSFDTVLASNVFEHFAPDTVPVVVTGVVRMLKPGGRLLIVQPNFRLAWRAYFDDYTHRSIFTDVSLPALLRDSVILGGRRPERAIDHFERQRCEAEGVEAVVPGPAGDLLERPAAEGDGDEAEFHA